MVDFSKKQIQVYVNVREDGTISDSEIGEKMQRLEPADFFFIVDEDFFAKNNTTEEEFKESIHLYKVVLIGMKSELVKIEQPAEEPTETPTDAQTEPTDEPAGDPPIEEGQPTT